MLQIKAPKVQIKKCDSTKWSEPKTQRNLSLKGKTSNLKQKLESKSKQKWVPACGGACVQKVHNSSYLQYP